MSYLNVNIIDGQRTLHGQIHGSEFDALVAALAADPVTLEELDLALGRYQHRDEESRPFFRHFRAGLVHEPYDAGLAFIDLVGRVIAYESTYSAPGRDGVVFWHDGRSGTDTEIYYQLADDWRFFRGGDDRVSKFAPETEIRPAPLDERAVLFGKLPDWIVRQVYNRRVELTADEDSFEPLIRSIHADWLLTPRDDLAGRSPRDCLLDARHNHIDFDTQHQSTRWSFVRAAPPGIPRDSHAYRYGGFGTHEIVVYYDLVRELLGECTARMAQRKISESDLPAEAEHLQRVKQDWLHGPQYDFGGRTPAAVIDRERRRLPEACSHQEAAGDDDCPICQEMGSGKFGPMFWHLDGSGMDDEFAFSFERTRAEWDAKQQEYERWNREWNEKERLRKERGEPEFDPDDDLPF